MCTSTALSFGTGLIAWLGYGCSIVFACMSLGTLASAIIRGGKTRYALNRKRGQAEFNGDMNAFVAAGAIAFVVAIITVLALKLVG